MEFNWIVFPITTLIPLLVAIIWYHPNILGRLWVNQNISLPNLFSTGGIKNILMLLFSGLFLSGFLLPVVVHQMGLLGSLQGPELLIEGSEVHEFAKTYLEKYGTNFRTFKHGVLHGFIAALFFAFPVLTISSLVESGSFNSNLIHTGYFIIIFCLMGGVISAFV
jgi:hypothetical protein